MAQDQKRPARLALADRLALRPAEAAKALGLSERTFRDLIRIGPGAGGEKGSGSIMRKRKLKTDQFLGSRSGHQPRGRSDAARPFHSRGRHNSSRSAFLGDSGEDRHSAVAPVVRDAIA